MKYYFAITVKQNKGKWLIKDYDNYCSTIRNSGYDIIYKCFEIDRNNLLHFHGVFVSNRLKPYLKQIQIEKELHTHVKRIDSEDDLKAWAKYMTKEYINEDEYQQKLCTHEIQNYGYPF